MTIEPKTIREQLGLDVMESLRNKVSAWRLELLHRVLEDGTRAGAGVPISRLRKLVLEDKTEMIRGV